MTTACTFTLLRPRGPGEQIRRASPLCRPEAAARKLLEIANAHEPYMDGRILIEQLNGAMLYQHKATAR